MFPLKNLACNGLRRCVWKRCLQNLGHFVQASICHCSSQCVHQNYPDSKVDGVNMGPIWGRQDPGGPHVVPINLAIWEALFYLCCAPSLWLTIDCSPQIIIVGWQTGLLLVDLCGLHQFLFTVPIWWGPSYQYRLFSTLHAYIITWAVKCGMDEINYPFPNISGCTIEVWEWMSSFISHFEKDIIFYP